MQNCGIIRTFHKDFESDEETCEREDLFDFCICKEIEGKHLKEEYFENNGKIEGVYKKYYKNGNINVEWNYINGLRNGMSKKYYINGHLNWKCNYSNDKMNGIYKVYDTNGILMDEIIMEDGKKI